MNANPHAEAIELLEAQGFYDAARFLRGTTTAVQPVDESAAKQPLGVFLGIPVYEDPGMKTPTFAFGSMQKYAAVPVVDQDSDR